MAKKSKEPVNKSAFVRDFMQNNPEANRKAIEEAWLAAGHDGVISSALVSKIRAGLGLIGLPRQPEAETESTTISAPTISKPGKPEGTADKSRARRSQQAQAEANGTTAVLGSRSEPTIPSGARAVATGRGGPQGKTAFVRDFILKNPTANRKAVEEAWLAAGNEGPISSALVSNLRSEMGLTGKKRGQSAKGKASGTTAEPTDVQRPRSGGRDAAVAEIEGDIDRIVFRLMALGGMEEIEDELRKLRRLLYRSYSE